MAGTDRREAGWPACVLRSRDRGRIDGSPRVRAGLASDRGLSPVGVGSIGLGASDPRPFHPVATFERSQCSDMRFG